jgi:hypothetical protein
MSLNKNRLNNMVIIEFDGYNGWEKYLVTYSQAITLIPILAPKLPSITITDYEYSKVSRQDYKEPSVNHE